MSNIVIPASEFKERIVKIQCAMAEKNIDAMLFTATNTVKKICVTSATSGPFLNEPSA